jgi:hypothetical protein
MLFSFVSSHNKKESRPNSWPELYYPKICAKLSFIFSFIKSSFNALQHKSFYFTRIGIKYVT